MNEWSNDNADNLCMKWKKKRVQKYLFLSYSPDHDEAHAIKIIMISMYSIKCASDAA